jgi:hypothetical protein
MKRIICKPVIFFAEKLPEPRFMGLKRLAGFFPSRHCEPQAKQSRNGRLSDRLGRFFKILDCFGQALAMTRGRFRYCVPQAIVICLMLVNFPRGALCLSAFVAGNCLN